MSVPVKGFGRRPIATSQQAAGPSSETLQGKNPREVEAWRCRALWGFGHALGGLEPSRREDDVILGGGSGDRL